MKKALASLMMAAALILTALILANTDGSALSKWKVATMDGKGNDVLVEEIVTPPTDELVRRG